MAWKLTKRVRIAQEAPEGVSSRHLDIPTSPHLDAVLQKLHDKGHKALIVGGAVRDAMLGEKPKDVDIEVYGTNYDDLADTLKPHGKVNLVGNQFGVIKFTDHDRNDYDFSLPRRDNKTGIGHKDFKTEFDPDITPKEAASRRDFTFNALAYDPVEHKLHDYHGGEQDLKDRVLRHTSDAFSEDPLRVLRGMQFSARFGMKVHPDTAKLSQSIAHEYSTIPKERVSEEWMKMTKGSHPGNAIHYLKDTGWHKNFPELHAMYGVKQDAEWHPEGDLEHHTAASMDAAAKIADREGRTGDDRAVTVFSAMLHDVGKPVATQTDGDKITSYGHEDAGVPIAHQFLDSIGVKADISKKVGPLVREHMQHLNYEKNISSRTVRRLAQRVAPASIKELSHVMDADISGRPPLEGGLPVGAQKMLDKAEESHVTDKPMEKFVNGRDVIPYFPGQRPGPHIGEVLNDAYQAQLDGQINSPEEGKAWLEKRFSPKEPPPPKTGGARDDFAAYKLARGCEDPECPLPPETMPQQLHFDHGRGDAKVPKSYRGRSHDPSCDHVPPCYRSDEHHFKVWRDGDPDGELANCTLLHGDCHARRTFSSKTAAPQSRTMWHVAMPSQEDAIRQHGLVGDEDGHVYLTSDPAAVPIEGHIWKVHVPAGVTLHDDPDNDSNWAHDNPSDRPWKYVKEGIGPENLELVGHTDELKHPMTDEAKRKFYSRTSKTAAPIVHYCGKCEGKGTRVDPSFIHEFEADMDRPLMDYGRLCKHCTFAADSDFHDTRNACNYCNGSGLSSIREGKTSTKDAAWSTCAACLGSGEPQMGNPEQTDADRRCIGCNGAGLVPFQTSGKNATHHQCPNCGLLHELDAPEWQTPHVQCDCGAFWDDPRLPPRTASWRDVRNKAVRLRNNNLVEIIRLDPDVIASRVQGDHHMYDVVLYRQFPDSWSITFWSCSCKWGDWAFKRQVTYVGRLCSHALATLYAAHGKEYQKTGTNKYVPHLECNGRGCPACHNSGLYLRMDDRDIPAPDADPCPNCDSDKTFEMPYGLPGARGCHRCGRQYIKTGASVVTGSVEPEYGLSNDEFWNIFDHMKDEHKRGVSNISHTIHDAANWHLELHRQGGAWDSGHQHAGMERHLAACPTCKATGRDDPYHENPDRRCDSCKGSGLVSRIRLLSALPDANYMKCQQCRGKGLVWDDCPCTFNRDFKPDPNCPNCKGKGAAYTDSKCVWCHGSGLAPSCVTCGGQGWRTDKGEEWTHPFKPRGKQKNFPKHEFRVAALESEHIDYPANWDPSPGSDIGKWQHGTLPTSYVRDIALKNEPDLQTNRYYSDQEFEDFKSDIKKNGIQNPLLIMVNDDRDVVKNHRPKIQIEGHHRLLVAHQLGMDEVPVEVRYFGTTHKDGMDLFRKTGRLGNAKLTFYGFSRPVTITVEVATDMRDIMQGLMGRTYLAPRSGMVFKYQSPPSYSSFWMKNTLLPLSIAFWDRQGRIIEVKDMEPCPPGATNCPTYSCSQPYWGAVEVNRGFFRLNGIGPGTRIELLQ